MSRSGALSDKDGQTSNQNIWLQMSPYPRPVYGWANAGKKLFKLLLRIENENSVEKLI